MFISFCCKKIGAGLPEFFLRQKKNIFSSPRRSNPLWSSHCFIHTEYWALGGRRKKLTIHHIVPRSRIRGACAPRIHTPPYRDAEAQGTSAVNLTRRENLAIKTLIVNWVRIAAQLQTHILCLSLTHMLAVSTSTPKLEGYPFSIVRDCCIS
jgi:hypothetical protein